MERKIFMKKAFIKTILSLLVVSFILIGNYDSAYAAKTDTYMESPHSLLKFKKKGNKLIVKTSSGFSKNNKSFKKKTIKLKIAKKCKWRYKNNGNRFPDAKCVKKFKYKDMRKTIYEDMQINDNGYHLLVIKVKKKKIISVTYECI